MKTYKIFVTLQSQIDSGSVWSRDYFPNGKLVKITISNKKSVIVKHRHIDQNFEYLYNNSSRTITIPPSEEVLIMEEYYRDKLNILKQEKYMIDLKPVSGYRVELVHLWYHSNSSTRFSTRLAVVLFILSILLSIGISLFSCA